ncbi:hypothetical protein BD310DRAFT_935984 [Dichomitus squalens]|uniref:Uncharacterized protein n=1 Tax=Dichomitus squalens TaxID=114155 RepID=A0A4Q9PJU3_9APHY|nr:hypothetical protein BD310DRAFT_935984 [Dichomitus squalens]
MSCVSLLDIHPRAIRNCAPIFSSKVALHIHGLKLLSLRSSTDRMTGDASSFTDRIVAPWRAPGSTLPGLVCTKLLAVLYILLLSVRVTGVEYRIRALGALILTGSLHPSELGSMNTKTTLLKMVLKMQYRCSP